MKARYIVIPLIFILILTSLFFWWRNSANQVIKYDLFEVRRGSVASTVSVSGSVVSNQKLELGFLSPGIIRSVKVEVGDIVESGDLLASLDNALLYQQAASSRANLAGAQAMYDKVFNSLREIDRQVLNNTLEQSKITLDSARNNLNNAMRSSDLEINNAQTSLNNAQIAYGNALDIYNAMQYTISQPVEIAKIALDSANTILYNAQNNYYSIINLYNLGQASISDVQQAQIVLTNADTAHKNAQVNYNTALQQTSIGKINAKTNLDTANSALMMAENAYSTVLISTDIKINNMQNALLSAQSGYDLAISRHNQSLASPHASDINSALAQVNAAKAGLGIIQTQIARSNLYAPISGTITMVNIKLGELSGISNSITLETAEDLLIEANISEVDINAIAIDQSVKIEFDAFMDNSEIRGKVINIDPAATIILGTINYKVTILPEENYMHIRPSMTADLEILTQQKEEVLFVPRRSLSRQNNGYTAKILTIDGPTEVDIEVGLIGDNEIEIISGLKIGDQIILGEL